MKYTPAVVLAVLSFLLASCAVEGKIYDLKELDEMPSVKGRRAGPIYPFELMKAGISGEAILRFVVDTQGHTRDIEVVETNHPSFGQAAAEAIAKWNYTPGKKDGAAVNARMQIPVGFTINR